jgi:hypothetical protein
MSQSIKDDILEIKTLSFSCTVYLRSLLASRRQQPYDPGMCTCVCICINQNSESQLCRISLVYKRYETFF